MKKLIFITLITIELFVIALVSKNILASTNSRESVNPISKEKLVFPDPNNLKYFFEPVPNSIDKGNEWVPYKAEYTINSDSLNERKDYDKITPPGTYRIITLGDSYTFGLFVNTASNWTERLEDRLNSESLCPNYNKYEVINLGMQGYDIQYELNRYVTRGRKYHPSMIIWLLKDDDFLQINEKLLPLEKEYSIQMHESGEFDRLVESGDYSPSWRKATKEINSKNSKTEVLNEQRGFINQLISENPGYTLLTTLPSTSSEYKNILKEFAGDLSDNYNFTKRYSREVRHTLYYDGLPNIYKQKELRFENDGHPTVQGHLAIADSLYEHIKNLNIICD